ncbi:hypothetical protein [Hyphococcus sp.]|uniref:hypothetical protein n=1 Tax=Hyphococcus sp. TaxID=2038636 RepID=UPI00207E66EB|nr:MAG: hypothetical protein DHS20C04_05640 [Marinicaulis sp.]
MKNAENPRNHADDRDYSPLFIIELGKQFDFDGNNPEIIEEINYIRSGYIAYQAAEGHEAYSKEVRSKYIEVNKAIAKFRAVLKKHETQDLASDMYYGALHLGEAPPQTEFPEITEFEKTRGKPYFLELMRLLRILEKGVDKNIDHLAPLPGRKPDYPVQALVRRAAEFWEDFLDRKFTVDYHGSEGLTSAFSFVQKLINEIEPMPDNKIINAMRAEITARNKDKKIPEK